jgi:transcriptional regulator of heat shock response
LTLLDEAIIVQRWLQQAAQPDPMHVFFGDDLDQPFLEPVGFVFADFHVGQNLQGSIGVIGPARLNFPLVIPRVRYYAEIIQDMAREW